MMTASASPGCWKATSARRLTQIAVLLLPTVSGESIESFSLRVANSWKLGHQGLDNGILVALAMKKGASNRARRRDGKKYISSATAQSIIDNSMVPAFRKGDFAGGLHAALKDLMKEGRSFVIHAAELERARQR